MPLEIEYKKGINTITFILPKQSLPPNDYILSLGASFKNTKWIVNQFNFDITILTTVSKPNYEIFKTILQ